MSHDQQCIMLTAHAKHRFLPLHACTSVEMVNDCVSLKNSRLFVQFNDLLQWYQIPEHTMPQFYVNNPGNLSNMYRFQRLNQMVYELEHMNGSWGAQSTNYFIRDFIDFEKQWNEADYSNDSLNGSILLREDDLPIFLDWPEYQRWRGF
ncbi:hypothetical protein WUBG_14811 [Wuchereria bancrofti]|uniref:Uncharacterized protein n=1 Tax=Wuchereria bancrofti TaxID=6293 RepID=J9DWW8_WUCBA|nr:hypothetical protein WUBG_14811 [Wuchereria bancrofti]